MGSVLAKENLYLKMVVYLLRTGNIIDHKVTEVLKEFEITHIQFNILRILEAAYPDNLSVGEITKGLLFPTSDVTRLLDRLEKRKLVARSLCPENRRKMNISITGDGLRIIESSMPKIEKKLDRFYSDRITEEERDQIMEILKKFRS